MAKKKFEKSEKKEKKEKKEKRSKENGVSKHKKEKLKQSDSVVPRVEATKDADGDAPMAEAASRAVQVRPIGALVPFANPLVDEKACKKIFKSVKKAAKVKGLKRGVKEVVKALRKSAPATPGDLEETHVPYGVVILAADISPMDVISHIPVLCEDHGVPYAFVTSRAELGAAGSTKRPTSVVLVGKERGKDRRAEKAKQEKGEKKDGEAEGAAKEEEIDWDAIYEELVKVVRKAGRNVRI